MLAKKTVAPVTSWKFSHHHLFSGDLCAEHAVDTGIRTLSRFAPYESFQLRADDEHVALWLGQDMAA
jgi:hypothetical protein